MRARQIDRTQEVLLSRRRGVRCTLPQDEFAFDAQELGDAPVLLAAFASREHLVDNREPFGSFTVTPGGVRNFEEKWRVKKANRVLREVGERGAQKLQTAANVAPFNEPHPFEASTNGVPPPQRVPGGEIHERLYVALRQGQIADEKGDGAG